jgi:hypothetical protein
LSLHGALPPNVRRNPSLAPHPGRRSGLQNVKKAALRQPHARKDGTRADAAAAGQQKHDDFRRPVGPAYDRPPKQQGQ